RRQRDTALDHHRDRNDREPDEEPEHPVGAEQRERQEPFGDAHGKPWGGWEASEAPRASSRRSPEPQTLAQVWTPASLPEERTEAPARPRRAPAPRRRGPAAPPWRSCPPAA